MIQLVLFDSVWPGRLPGSCTLLPCTRVRVIQLGFMYTARANGGFTRDIQKQCTRNPPQK